MTPFVTVRHPWLSLFQAAAAAFARATGVGEKAAHPLVGQAGVLATGAPADDCTTFGWQYFQAPLAGDAARRDETADRLAWSLCDPTPHSGISCSPPPPRPYGSR